MGKISVKVNKVDNTDDELNGASKMCRQPMQVIGVQKESPITWSNDGNTFAFVSRNYSLYICSVEYVHGSASYVNVPDSLLSNEHAKDQNVLQAIVVDERKPRYVQRQGFQNTNDDTEDTNNECTIRLINILPGHMEEILFLSFHPRSKNVVISGGKEGFFVWDLTADEPLVVKVDASYSKEVHESDILCCAWILDEFFATGSRDNQIKIWKLGQDEVTCLETLYGHKSGVLSMVFSFEMKVLFSAGRDSTIKKWDMSSLYPSVIGRRDDDGSITCNLMANLDGHRGDVVTLSVISDGQILFSGARDNTIKVWDTVLGRELRMIGGHTADVRRFAFFEDDTFMYSCSLDGTIKLWRVLHEENAMKDELTEEDIERDREAADKIALDNILYGGSSSTEPSLLTSNVKETEELLCTFQAHDADVFAMEINPKFPIMATASLHEIKFWHVENIGHPVHFADFLGHSDAITDVALIRNDSMLLTASLDYNLHVYDVASIKRVAHIHSNGSILTMSVSPDESMIFCAGNDYVIRAYPLTSDNRTVRINTNASSISATCDLIGHSGRVYCTAISPDGHTLLSGAHDYRIFVWDLRAMDGKKNLSPRQTVTAHQGHVLDVKFNEPSNASLMAASCGNDHAIRVWDVKKGKIYSKFVIDNAHASVVSCVAWGKAASKTALFSGGWDTSIKVWTPSPTAPTSPTHVLNGHTGRITQLEVNHTGLLLFSVSADGAIMCWDAVQPYNALVSYLGAFEDGAVQSLSVGSRSFATGFSDGMIKVWPTLDGEADGGETSFVTNQDYKNTSKKRGTVKISGMRTQGFSDPNAGMFKVDTMPLLEDDL